MQFSSLQQQDEFWMRRAMALAEQAEAIGEVPVGALIVAGGEVIGEGFNSPIIDSNPCAHAEVKALQMAAAARQNYRVINATLYVTLEPCPMCAGALVHGRIERIVFGAFDNKSGAAGSVMQIADNPALNHRIQVTGGVLADACAEQLSSFFQRRRKEKRALKRASEGNQLAGDNPKSAS